MSQIPIYPVRLDESDKGSLALIKDKFQLTTISDAIRASIRVMQDLILTKEQLRAKLEKYEQDNPDSRAIRFEQ